MAVLIEWGDLAYKEWYENVSYDYISMTSFFICSLGSMLLLRFAFAIAVCVIINQRQQNYHKCVKFCYIFCLSLLVFIFPELAVFAAVIQSHNNTKQQTDGFVVVSVEQLGIQLLEANIESMPQVIICVYFFVFFLCQFSVMQGWNLKTIAHPIHAKLRMKKVHFFWKKEHRYCFICSNSFFFDVFYDTILAHKKKKQLLFCIFFKQKNKKQWVACVLFEFYCLFCFFLQTCMQRGAWSLTKTMKHKTMTNSKKKQFN